MTIADNLAALKSRIDTLTIPGHRPASLVAVSKTFSADAVREAVEAGQRAFGENYVQEGVSKILELSDLADQGLEWHFIGPLQSNKAKPVAQHFDWVHSIDRLKIAKRLSALRPDSLPELQVCLQINVSGEESKSGIAPEEVQALASAVDQLPRLKLRGLMTIPEPTDDTDLLRRRFGRLRELLEQLNSSGFSLDTLSMGMTDDLDIAITEGSTMIRVGSAIFGYRPRKQVSGTI